MGGSENGLEVCMHAPGAREISKAEKLICYVVIPPHIIIYCMCGSENDGKQEL